LIPPWIFFPFVKKIYLSGLSAFFSRAGAILSFKHAGNVHDARGFVKPYVGAGGNPSACRQ
jgi:hypothetical protein